MLDRNFQPQTYDDKVLFREQQQYLYAVFIRILRTDKSKAIVRKYKSTFNAQSIYRELQEYATNSTQAVLDSNMLLQYITTVILHVLMMARGIARQKSSSFTGWSKYDFTRNWLIQLLL